MKNITNKIHFFFLNRAQNYRIFLQIEVNLYEIVISNYIATKI